MIKWVILIFLVLFLTVLTQIGGLILLLGLLIARTFGWHSFWKKLLLSSILYLIISLAIIPQIAPIFGRESVIHTELITPATWLTVLLNRNYVRPSVNKLLLKTAKKIEPKGIKILYLDANFPFWNGFPLLPHLSHNDGKKLDLALIYENKNGEIVPIKKSRTGYGVYVSPRQGEVDQTQKCKKAGYVQYDYSKYFSLGGVNRASVFSEKGTKILVDALLENSEIQKIFIEPHLRSRLGLTDRRIRFHGCRAVRHDDHIHLQIN